MNATAEIRPLDLTAWENVPPIQAAKVQIAELMNENNALRSNEDQLRQRIEALQSEAERLKTIEARAKAADEANAALHSDNRALLRREAALKNELKALRGQTGSARLEARRTRTAFLRALDVANQYQDSRTLIYRLLALIALLGGTCVGLAMLTAMMWMTRPF